MRVVSDTSPISNLAIIGRLDLLKRRYDVVYIPLAVAQELSALSHPGAQSAIAAALAEGWLLEASAPVSTSNLPFPLDPGEKEAIALALSIHADEMF
jgi:predicted nucleic acid-binding protein